MSELETVRRLARAAGGALEAARQRIDDLNVYPVPDGDTGTNMTLTVRSALEALDASSAGSRAELVREVTRAALLGARGNSGVILSQIVRGAADVLGDASVVDATALARALRGASDAAYASVREPVEGTMLTVIREVAEEAEAAAADAAVPDLLLALVRRGEEALERTTELLDVLRKAGVVDAGGAGVLELLRGLTSGVRGEPVPELPAVERDLSVQAIHQELSRYRYCTGFVVEGAELDAAALERELERLGDSLLVVGDRTALKVHVHTDDPGAAISTATAVGVIDRVEIADMHRQTLAREERLGDAAHERARTALVAVAAGAGNRMIFESFGASVVEGGQTMNPAASELVAAIEATGAEEVVVLPNNSNVVLTAEQAAGMASRRVRVVPTRSLQAGLAAVIVHDPASSADDNAELMGEAAQAVATGEVTVASRDADLDGLAVRKDDFLGFAREVPVAAGPSFHRVARVVVYRLLEEPRDVLTFLVGEDEPDLDGVLEDLRETHPELEVEVHEGGQPHYPLLVSAE